MVYINVRVFINILKNVESNIQNYSVKNSTVIINYIFENNHLLTFSSVKKKKMCAYISNNRTFFYYNITIVLICL